MNMLAEMLLHEPAPMAIWAALLLATVPAMVVLASPAGVRNPGRALLDACAFLAGRPLPRPLAAEPVTAGFFATDHSDHTAYTVFASEAAGDGSAAPEFPTPAVPSASVSTGGTAFKPASADVALSEPASADVALSEPASADVALSEPASADVALSEPASADVTASGAVSGDVAADEALPAAASLLQTVPAQAVPFQTVSAQAAPFQAVPAQAAPVRPFLSAGAVSADSAVVERESTRRSRLGRFLYRAARRREDRLRREEEAIRLVRYADEVRIAAESAGYASDRWQEHWEAASERVDATFHAWQAADTRARRILLAAPFHTPATDQSPAEYADRERHLHLAVRAAAERGELPTSAVADALTGRGGWDARLHPVDQELVIQRASAAHLEAVWNRAVEAEARAWDDAQAARRNWQSLCQEAILAESCRSAVHHLLPPEPVTAPPATHPAVLAQIA